MDKPSKTILAFYFLAISCVGLFVPWTGCFGRYSFVFSPPYCGPAGGIDYGTVIAELIAVTGIAGFFWILQDKFPTELTARMRRYWLEEEVTAFIGGGKTSRLYNVLRVLVMMAILAMAQSVAKK